VHGALCHSPSESNLERGEVRFESETHSSRESFWGKRQGKVVGVHRSSQVPLGIFHKSSKVKNQCYPKIRKQTFQILNLVCPDVTMGVL
jgi:hypothetical protein